MKPDKNNFAFLVNELKSFGFKYKSTDRSILEIDKEDVQIVELVNSYVRDDREILITRIQVIESIKKTKKDIGLYMSLSKGFSGNREEIFEIEDFRKYFKDEIRKVRIDKALE